MVNAGDPDGKARAATGRSGHRTKPVLPLVSDEGATIRRWAAALLQPNHARDEIGAGSPNFVANRPFDKVCLQFETTSPDKRCGGSSAFFPVRAASGGLEGSMEFCSGLDRIIAAFEDGRSAGLRLSASERDCPHAGQHQLAEYWLDGFHVGRDDRDGRDRIMIPTADLRDDRPSRSIDDGGPGLGTHA